MWGRNSFKRKSLSHILKLYTCIFHENCPIEGFWQSVLSLDKSKETEGPPIHSHFSEHFFSLKFHMAYDCRGTISLAAE